jgi:nucleotide-binding universal stress UspA family protein
VFKRILVAVDGSAAAAAGLNAALDLAADQEATLTALYVVDDGSVPTHFEDVVYPQKYVDAYIAAGEKYGRKLLDRAASSARKQDIGFEPVILRSHGQAVAGVIVAHARKQQADVIVLGTHGRRGLKRVLMGSDAEEVVRSASVPVLLVRDSYRSTRKSRAATATREGAGSAVRAAPSAPAYLEAPARSGRASSRSVRNVIE